MPSVSRKQQQMMAIDLERKRKGLPTRTGMTEQQLEDFASTKRKGLPERMAPEGMESPGQMAKERAMGFKAHTPPGENYRDKLKRLRGR